MNDKITKAKEVAKARWHDDPRGTAFLLASVQKTKAIFIRCGENAHIGAAMFLKIAEL